MNSASSGCATTTRTLRATYSCCSSDMPSRFSSACLPRESFWPVSADQTSIIQGDDVSRPALVARRVTHDPTPFGERPISGDHTEPLDRTAKRRDQTAAIGDWPRTTREPAIRRALSRVLDTRLGASKVASPPSRARRTSLPGCPHDYYSCGITSFHRGRAYHTPSRLVKFLGPKFEKSGPGAPARQGCRPSHLHYQTVTSPSAKSAETWMIRARRRSAPAGRARLEMRPGLGPVRAGWSGPKPAPSSARLRARAASVLAPSRAADCDAIATRSATVMSVNLAPMSP